MRLIERLLSHQWGQSQLQSEEIQIAYDSLESSIKEVMRQFGIPKNNLKTDDKLGADTKQLIQKRAHIKSKVTLNLQE